MFNTFDVNTSTSVSVDSNQRAITSVLREERDKSNNVVSSRFVVCAEPSPDSMLGKSGSMTAENSSPSLLASSSQGQKMTVSGEQTITPSTIGERNDTIQLLRDGLYRSCEAYQNGALDETEYSLLANKYANIMVTLLAIEKMTDAVENFSSNGTPNNSSETSTDPKTNPIEVLAASITQLVKIGLQENTERVLTRRCLTYLSGLKYEDPNLPLVKLCESELLKQSDPSPESSLSPTGVPQYRGENLNNIDLNQIATRFLLDEETKWFSFELSSPEQLLISAIPEQESGDPYIYLYRFEEPGEAILLSQNDDADNLIVEFMQDMTPRSSLIHEPLAPGKYLIAVQWYGISDNIGDFMQQRLRLQLQTADNFDVQGK
ncbi:hypothetical protein KUL49_39850 [Alteromonas sp. KUL49]|nr:hypothetical protein KUL49_39850 [Alteromonas sp. KUL49]